jgi:DNA helicase HerA-like ATPase
VPEQEPTRIGRVRHVLGATVTVALDPDLAGVAPIYRGRLQAVGQIGSLVRIPQGMVDLVASVSLVAIAELAGAQPPTDLIQSGERWLQVQLLGEIDRGSDRFERGVGSYPGLDDAVHFATPDDLSAIFPAPSKTHLRLGRLAAADEVAVCLDATRLVTRHAAVVGSTGAGKTSAVASLLQAFVRGGWTASNIVVIDPHGEYAGALGESAAVRSVLGEGEAQLRIPFWALPADEILRIFAGSTGGGATQSRFNELVVEQRRAFAEAAEWLTIDPSAVTSDSPIPFDLAPVWYRLDYDNRATYQQKSDLSTVCEVTPGSATTLTGAEFEPYGPASQPPQKGPLHGVYGAIPELLRLGLLDPRLRFLLELPGDPNGDDPLIGAVQEWLGMDRPVSVLDFSGVPAEAADVAIGVVLDLLFEVAVRTPRGETGIGRPSPVLIALEEAHRYLGESANPKPRAAANRIAREGRKYGVGLLLITQRPSELPETALAQCGTLIALRLSNSTDQGRIRAALPDVVTGLASVLPSLRTGEAVASGEALVLPVRMLIDRPDPEPLAEDPTLSSWRREPVLPDVAAALAAWRGTYED